MADELVDIINEQNEVIGQMMKTEAHVTGALHRTVISQIIGSDGRWTLVIQASDRQDAGRLVSPVGGHVMAGESADQALCREAMEETGISVNDYKKIGNARFNRDVLGRSENHLFLCYEIYTDQELLHNHESVGIECFSKQELHQAYQLDRSRFGDAFHFVVAQFYPELLD